jgi:hypothetical protein
MKSDVIRINDYGYMSELSKRIEQLQLENQENVIKSLEEREKKRQTKLIIKGYIDRPYDNESDDLEIKGQNSRSKSPLSSKLTSKIQSANSLTPFRLPKI